MFSCELKVKIMITEEQYLEAKRIIEQYEKQQLNKHAVINSASHEPDFRTQKGEWIVWNMLEYGNSLETACKLLRQKEIIDSI